jgi:hypothetical protein
MLLILNGFLDTVDRRESLLELRWYLIEKLCPVFLADLGLETV